MDIVKKKSLKKKKKIGLTRMTHEKDASFFFFTAAAFAARRSRFQFLADGAKKGDPGETLRESDLVR